MRATNRQCVSLLIVVLVVLVSGLINEDDWVEDQASLDSTPADRLLAEAYDVLLQGSQKSSGGVTSAAAKRCLSGDKTYSASAKPIRKTKETVEKATPGKKKEYEAPGEQKAHNKKEGAQKAAFKQRGTQAAAHSQELGFKIKQRTDAAAKNTAAPTEKVPKKKRSEDDGTRPADGESPSKPSSARTEKADSDVQGQGWGKGVKTVYSDKKEKAEKAKMRSDEAAEKRRLASPEEQAGAGKEELDLVQKGWHFSRGSVARRVAKMKSWAKLMRSTRKKDAFKEKAQKAAKVMNKALKGTNTARSNTAATTTKKGNLTPQSKRAKSSAAARTLLESGMGMNTGMKVGMKCCLIHAKCATMVKRYLARTVRNRKTSSKRNKKTLAELHLATNAEDRKQIDADQEGYGYTNAKTDAKKGSTRPMAQMRGKSLKAMYRAVKKAKAGNVGPKTRAALSRMQFLLSAGRTMLLACVKGEAARSNLSCTPKKSASTKEIQGKVEVQEKSIERIRAKKDRKNRIGTEGSAKAARKKTIESYRKKKTQKVTQKTTKAAHKTKKAAQKTKKAAQKTKKAAPKKVKKVKTVKQNNPKLNPLDDDSILLDTKAYTSAQATNLAQEAAKVKSTMEIRDYISQAENPWDAAGDAIMMQMG